MSENPKSVSGRIHGYSRRRMDDETCALGEKCVSDKRRDQSPTLFLNRRTKPPQWICRQCATNLRII